MGTGQRILITDVEVAGRPGLVDVRCAQGLITQLGSALNRTVNERVIAGEGGALLPGLHDHHAHLFALAALCNSVQTGPPKVCNREQLVAALSDAPGSGWVRGVGYHESVAGELNLVTLDQIIGDRPLKIQHRSGKMWMVNSPAAEQLSLHRHIGVPGIELDRAGQPTGRLFRLDSWMRNQLAQVQSSSWPSLGETSRRLASFGVTGVTDTSPDNGSIAMGQFTAAANSGELLQKMRVMGDSTLPQSGCEQVQRGERKVMLDENALPGWDNLSTVFSDAHRQGRAVAVHCVTPTELVLALSVLREAGVHPGDRIEHASLVPPQLIPLIRELGVRVVTQPGFIHERGDQYLADVSPDEHGHLYRCQSLLSHSVPLAGSTDAPYGNPDPWAAMRAAVKRRSRSGPEIGHSEALDPEQALALFTSAADDPGGPARRVEVGGLADLCLLNRCWEEARLRLRSEDVIATIGSGNLIYQHTEQLEHGVRHATAVA